MGALVFVTFELSPFMPGKFGRVIHNLLKAMSPEDRARSIVVLLDEQIPPAVFSAFFPGARLVCVNSADEGGRHERLVHNPPRLAYSNTDWHWKSATVFRALRALAAQEPIDYVEFPDFGGLGFVSTQEKRLSGLLKNATLAVRLHSSYGIILKSEAHNISANDLNLIDLERKALRDCDLIIGHLAPVAEAIRHTLGISREEWTPRLHIHAPPVLLDTRGPGTLSTLPSPATPIIFGSKMQRFERPDLFVRGLNIFCNAYPDLGREIFLACDSFDTAYRNSILKLIPEEHAVRFHLDAPRLNTLREPIIAKSVFVATSDCKSFFLPAYEAALLGAVVVINAANPAFGNGTPWIDGMNCLKFDGSPAGLAAALARAFALTAPLEIVRVPADPLPWNIPLPERNTIRDADAPLVTVLVPHYNLGAYLMATLESVLQQSYPNIEVVLIDDCSTDAASVDLIAHLASLGREGLKIIQRRQHRVSSGAQSWDRSRRGQISIAPRRRRFAESSFIELAVNALEKNKEFDIVVPQAAYFCKATDIPMRGETRDFPDYKSFIGEPLINGVRENRYSAATALFRTEVLRKHRYWESLSCYED